MPHGPQLLRYTEVQLYLERVGGDSNRQKELETADRGQREKSEDRKDKEKDDSNYGNLTTEDRGEVGP